MTIPMLNQQSSAINTEYGIIPWDSAENRPVDWLGDAGIKWDMLKAKYGISEPAPYVAPPPTAKKIRADAFKADIDRKALINAIKNATPAQIKTYINNNVTDLASARTMLYRLTLLVALTLKD